MRMTNMTSKLWLKLSQPNTWVCTFPKPENLHIKCKKYNKDKGDDRIQKKKQV